MNASYTKIPLVRLQAFREKDVRYSGGSMDSPKKAVEIIRHMIGDADREYVITCCVDIKMNPTTIEITAIGTTDSCLAVPRDIYKNAVLSNASGLLVFHNHPSGLSAPSDDDILVTERLEKAGALLGIELVDHIIIGDDNYYSFREEKRLPGISRCSGSGKAGFTEIV